MLLLLLLFAPIGGLFVLFLGDRVTTTNVRTVTLFGSVLCMVGILISFILYDFSINQFQLVKEQSKPEYLDLYIGVDGLSVYFAILTAIIGPISLMSNWISINEKVRSYVAMVMLIESLLLIVFLALDMLLFYIFFESILPPLFLLVGMFGADNRIKAGFYLFLYTLAGSLFLLLSIVSMSNIINATDYDNLFKSNFIYYTQLFLFYGIFVAFAVKTPTMFLNTWLLKAHVESPLSGSIVLAAIVLKLSLYGILRLILPLLPKAYVNYTYIIFLIGVVTIVYASFSTIRTIDVKELIAYSSVCHAAVYLLSLFSNSLQGIEGSINLGLAHGLVSPGLFICAGGILYDRFHSRSLLVYKGMTQLMPLFALGFFILCLANCGAPLSLNFVGEFLSLYGVVERSFLFGLLACSSIVFSAAYTILMYQKIAFGGSYSQMFTMSVPDTTYREFSLLLVLAVPTVLLGIYPAPILDGIHYSVSSLLYCFDFSAVSCDGPHMIEFDLVDENPTPYPPSPIDNIATLFRCALYFTFSPLSFLIFIHWVSLSGKPGTGRRWREVTGIGKGEEWCKPEDGIELTPIKPRFQTGKAILEEIYKRRPLREPEPCYHKPIDRYQLRARDFQAYSGKKCVGGNFVAIAPNFGLGSRCNGCVTNLCSNPNCMCKFPAPKVGTGL